MSASHRCTSAWQPHADNVQVTTENSPEMHNQDPSIHVRVIKDVAWSFARILYATESFAIILPAREF